MKHILCITGMMLLSCCDSKRPSIEQRDSREKVDRVSSVAQHPIDRHDVNVAGQNIFGMISNANIALVQDVFSAVDMQSSEGNFNLNMYNKALARARFMSSTNVAWLEEAVAYFSNILVDIELLSPSQLSSLGDARKYDYALSIAAKSIARNNIDDKKGASLYSGYLVDNDLIMYLPASNAVSVYSVRSRSAATHAEECSFLNKAVGIAENAHDDYLLLTAYMQLAVKQHGDSPWIEKALQLTKKSAQLDQDSRQSIQFAALSIRIPDPYKRAKAIFDALKTADSSLKSCDNARLEYEMCIREAAAQRVRERVQQLHTETAATDSPTKEVEREIRRELENGFSVH